MAEKRCFTITHKKNNKPAFYTGLDKNAGNIDPICIDERTYTQAGYGLIFFFLSS